MKEKLTYRKYDLRVDDVPSRRAGTKQIYEFNWEGHATLLICIAVPEIGKNELAQQVP